MTEKKKIWRFIKGVESKDLEDKLNELADASYQIFRVDRVEVATHGSTMQLQQVGRGHVPDAVYDIVAFDAVELGARSAATMTAALAKMAGLPTG